MYCKLTYVIRHIILLCIFTWSLLFISVQAYADNSHTSNVIIVVNTANKNLALSKQQIRHIYMGGAISRQFKAVNLPAGNPLRIDFNTKLVGLTESRIQAYWAQMRFTGRSKPPVEFSSTKEIIAYLLKEENAVAYLPADIKIPDELTVVTLTP
ncbi:hypothetical protein PspMM1_00350 [Pseudoalteromonas sp. MM1]|nr:hypothetical protein [Pseudoalteromonas sp. MM1]BED87567.1 hypothetical protein PspMM1_00350 [Pseudoalteromonas sp. MM1]